MMHVQAYPNAGTGYRLPPTQTGYLGHMDSVPPAAAIAAKLDRLSDAIERLNALDAPANETARIADRLLPKGVLRDWASGVPLGHPLHPALIGVPIGSWTAASCLDLCRGNRVAARRLVGLGLVAAVPTLISGVNDWLTTAQAERRVGFMHALTNGAGMLAYGASWIARRRHRHVTGTLLGLIGLGCTGAAGWLGGHLAYATGVGVDTTAFQAYPQEWTDAAAEADVPDSDPMLAELGPVPVLLTRHNGTLMALAARCTHRGGPLTSGETNDGCITCPWHGSVFDLASGAVRRGPATRPQPTLEVRVIDGRVQVRRSNEPRALRTNPIGP